MFHTAGGHRARSRSRVHGFGHRGGGGDRAQEKGWLRVPARHVRVCGGGNRLGGSVVAETLDCRRAGWLRLVGRACHAGAILWRSIYRRCSSRAVGSVPESATGATNRHRFSRHQRLRQSEPTSLCQPHLRARAPTQECVEDASRFEWQPKSRSAASSKAAPWEAKPAWACSTFTQGE